MILSRLTSTRAELERRERNPALSVLDAPMQVAEEAQAREAAALLSRQQELTHKYDPPAQTRGHGIHTTGRSPTIRPSPTIPRPGVGDY